MQNLFIQKMPALLLALVLLIAAAGCGEMVIGAPSEVDFERVVKEELPEEVKNWLDGKITKPGEETFSHEGKLYILAAYGEKPTAGYSVEINKIEKLDGQIIVYASFVDPAPDDVVATVITYPYDLVVIEDQGLPVVFEK